MRDVGVLLLFLLVEIAVCVYAWFYPQALIEIIDNYYSWVTGSRESTISRTILKSRAYLWLVRIVFFLALMGTAYLLIKFLIEMNTAVFPPFTRNEIGYATLHS